jgi:hypothetical protein
VNSVFGGVIRGRTPRLHSVCLDEGASNKLKGCPTSEAL